MDEETQPNEHVDLPTITINEDTILESDDYMEILLIEDFSDDNVVEDATSLVVTA